MGRWKFPITAQDPRSKSTDDTWTIGVSERLYRTIVAGGHELRHARMALLKDARHPLVIRQGWTRAGTESCFVYVCTPEVDYRKLIPNIETSSPPPDMSFLIFVLEGGEIDDWNWRMHDGDPTNPNNVTGEIIWTRPS